MAASNEYMYWIWCLVRAAVGLSTLGSPGPPLGVDQNSYENSESSYCSVPGAQRSVHKLFKAMFSVPGGECGGGGPIPQGCSECDLDSKPREILLWPCVQDDDVGCGEDWYIQAP